MIVRCVQTPCRYLLRSQREWSDRGKFERIYPRPSRSDTPEGDQLERLVGFLGQVYPGYASPKIAAADPLNDAKNGAGRHETSWMVREWHTLHVCLPCMHLRAYREDPAGFICMSFFGLGTELPHVLFARLCVFGL